MKAMISVVIGFGLLVGACATSDNTREKRPKDAAQINAVMAKKEIETGNLQLAKIKAEKAIKQDKDNALANNVNGTLKQRLGKIKEADVFFRRAVKLAPDQPEYANSYGVYLCEVGRIKEGVKQFIGVAENPLHRTPALAYENAATCELKAGQYEAAEDYLKRALKLRPNYANARFSLAKLQFRDRRFGEALGSVKRLEKDNKLNAAVTALGVRAATAYGLADVSDHFKELLRSRFPNSYQARALGY